MSPKLALAAAFFGVLVVIALIQGLTVHKIGFGPLSVEFAGGSDPGPDGPGGGPDTGGTDFDRATTVKGSWKKSSGRLTLEVVQVDQQDGHVRLTVKARNTSGEAMTLPLFGNFVATDESGRTYDAVVGLSSGWHEQVPAGQTVTGTIELAGTVDTGATKLTISFSTIFGFGAPRGSISVSGVPIPR